MPVSRWLPFLSALALASTDASATPVDYTHHSVRKALVLAYDPLQHEVVIDVEGQKLVLHTERALVFGNIHRGRLVDVAYESDGYRAEQIVVRPDKIRSWAKP